MKTKWRIRYDVYSVWYVLESRPWWWPFWSFKKLSSSKEALKECIKRPKEPIIYL